MALFSFKVLFLQSACAAFQGHFQLLEASRWTIVKLLPHQT